RWRCCAGSHFGAIAHSCCRGRPAAFLCALSLHDALPIWVPAERSARSLAITFVAPMQCDVPVRVEVEVLREGRAVSQLLGRALQDRKSTRLNSSHVKTSYAVFCLKKTNVCLLEALKRCAA